MIIEKFKEFPITYGLIILNIIAFLPLTVDSWAGELYRFGVLHGYSIFIQGEYYRLFSSMFLHNDMIHISMNMLSLYMVGRMVENLFKPWAYLGIYFMSGLFGSFLFLYMDLSGQAVGASGALFGIFGALAGFALVHRHRMQSAFMQFMRDFGIILVINFFIGIIFPSIAMSAHVGGLITGFIGGFIVAKNSNFLWIYLFVGGVVLFGMSGYFESVYHQIVF